MIACRYRTQPTLPASGKFKFKPIALCTISVLCCVSRPQSHYFIWQLSAATSCSLLHRIIAATLCQLPTREADWQREMTNDSCQVKCGCNPYRIGALASVSLLCSCIVKPQFFYLKFLFCFIFCFQILLVFFGHRSGSAQLSYHPRPDPLSTLFLSTLRPIPFANKWPTPLPLFALQYKYHTALFWILFR